MGTFARIDGGRVVELFETASDIAELFNPAIIWIDVTDRSPQPQVGWGYDGDAFAAPAVSVVTLADVQADLCLSVDAARDAAYAAFGGSNAGRIQEYMMARDDAVAYRAAGYTGTVPVGVSSWVTPERTAQQAADGIIATAEAWTAFVGTVRSYTLPGKYAVNVAADEASARTAADQAIASINAAVAYAQAQTEAAEAG